MQEEFKEYVTFMTTDRAGKEFEMAVVDEFEFEHKNYVVGALIEEDTLKEDGFFIFRVKEVEGELKVDKIPDPTEYQKIAQAYMEMEG